MIGLFLWDNLYSIVFQNKRIGLFQTGQVLKTDQVFLVVVKNRITNEEIKIMVTLSIEIEETILQKAQQRALQEGLTLNAVLSYYLNNYAENKERYQQATLKILELAQQSTAASKGNRWIREKIREEIYER
jgi:hypothetical protein